jgi:hypothetical protein
MGRWVDTEAGLDVTEEKQVFYDSMKSNKNS